MSVPFSGILRFPSTLRIASGRSGDAVGASGELNPAGYKRDAVAAVVRLTRQRVTSFLSSHDQDTDVATEIFTLEPSLKKGRSRTIPS